MPFQEPWASWGPTGNAGELLGEKLQSAPAPGLPDGCRETACCHVLLSLFSNKISAVLARGCLLCGEKDFWAVKRGGGASLNKRL